MMLYILRKDLEALESTGTLQPGQAETVWQSLMAGPAGSRKRFDVSHTLYYAGAVLMISAMGWLMAHAWDSIRGLGLTLIALVYAFSFGWLGLRLDRRHGLRLPGGLLLATAVCMVPLAVYGVQKFLGFWPIDGREYEFSSYHQHIRGCWLLMSLATAVASYAAFRLIRVPFLMLPMAIAVWYISMDIVPWIVGAPFPDFDLLRYLSMLFGAAMLGAAVVVDRRYAADDEDMAYWLYMVGILAFWGGLTMDSSQSELAKFGYAVINLLLMGLALVLRRRVIMACGAVGVMMYLGHLAYEVFEDFVFFPPVLLGVGLLLIFFGTRWKRIVPHLEAWVQRQVPENWQQWLPPER
jgi:hypothetical protein